MKRSLVVLMLCVSVTGLLWGVALRPAGALPLFKEAFDKRYIGDQSTPQRKALAEAVKTAGCNVCHILDTSKSKRNEYGDLLRNLGMSRSIKRDEAKLFEVFRAAEARKIGGGKQTYGETLKAGKLPEGK